MEEQQLFEELDGVKSLVMKDVVANPINVEVRDLEGNQSEHCVSHSLAAGDLLRDLVGGGVPLLVTPDSVDRLLLTLGGQALEPNDSLEANGVEDGCRINIATIPCDNLALGQPCTQSSDYFGKGTGKPEHQGLRPAENAVDGDCEDDQAGKSRIHCISHTKSDHEAWWECDLGSSFTIMMVRVWTRTSCMARLFPSWIIVSDTAMGTLGLSEARDRAVAETRLTDHQRESAWIMESPVQGRFVRVQLEGKSNLQLAQVEVFGEAAE